MRIELTLSRFFYSFFSFFLQFFFTIFFFFFFLSSVSRQGNYVLVAINYRLGIFGFLVSDYLKELDPEGKEANGGMNGIRDQLTALKWIYNHKCCYFWIS